MCVCICLFKLKPSENDQQTVKKVFTLQCIVPVSAFTSELCENVDFLYSLFSQLLFEK